MEVHGNIFTGKLDQDADARIVANEDYVDAAGLLNGYGADIGSAVFDKGNAIGGITLPAGTNTCIGVCEDKMTNTMFVFIHNSNNNNLIIRYREGSALPIARGSGLGFSATRKITHARVVNGELLYWTDATSFGTDDRAHGGPYIDGQPPRKINTYKGLYYKEEYEYELYAGVIGEHQFSTGRTYSVYTTDADGGDIQDQADYISDGTYDNDPAGGLDWLKTQIEADFPDDIVIEDCGGCKLKIRYINGGTERRLVIESDADDVILVGTNIYPKTLAYQHIDLLKEPPHCAPVAKYIYDPDTGTNNVRRMAAQFRVRYVYDDNEVSAWGPASNIALNIGPNGEIIESLNAIKVDFTELRLKDPDWLTMIRFVDICFRDGNSDDWKYIDRIPVCEIGISSQFYLFRNDKTYATVPSDELSTNSSLQVLKNFDYCPILCGTLEVSSNSDGNSLLFPGACQESYDNPDCIEMDLTAEEYTDDCLVDIIGTVTIVPDPNFAFGDPDFDYYPLGGIVVYLAGTSYFAISNNPADGTGDGSFRIKGVPNGKKYVLRAASHRCSFTDDHGPRLNLGNGLEWQRTSAPVIEMCGSLTYGDSQYERVIDLSAFVGTEFDLDVEAEYGDVQIQNQHYTNRVTAAPPGADSFNLYEYIVLDNDAVHDNNDDIIEARGCERQKVLGNARSTGVGADAELITDHNGYCFDGRFHPSGTAVLSGTIPVDDNTYHPAFANRSMYNGGFKELYEDSLSLVSNTNSTLANQQYIIINEAASFSALKHNLQASAVITGTSTPVSGVLFVYTRNGRQAVSGLDGSVTIPYFIPYDIAPDRDDDYIIAAYLADVCHEGSPATDKVLVEITDPPADPFITTAFEYDLAAITYTPGRFLKGGGEYTFGIVYEDRGNRTPGAAKGEIVRIPVHINGLTKWRVKWEINSVPPDWATHYRVVRMLNAVHLNYVQWAIPEVRYVRIPSRLETPVDTTFTAGDATHLLFKLYIPIEDSAATEFVNFFNAPDGQYGYVPQEGDRVRILLDNTGGAINTATNAFEAEIQGIYINDAGENWAIIPNVFGGLEITAGYLAEYFAPISSESGIYYEGGEDCYDIGDAGLSTRYHKGPIDNQTVGTTPASGYFTGGDTYWRRQLFTKTGIYLTEHQSPSRYLATACQDIGRPFALGNDNGARFAFNRHRVSAPYIPNSTINGLSSFSALDYQDINRSFGVIKASVFANNVLLAICQFKVQPIYISQSELMYLSGDTSVGRSDRIMNIAKESASDFGTNNPESVVSEHGSVFFWDAYNGSVVRYAGNGVQDISVGNVKYFRSLAAERVGVSNAFVYGGYDRKYKLYLITFLDHGSTTEVTMAFDETKGAWGPKQFFIPQMYGRMQQDLYTFVSGQAWKHHSSNTYSNYYGVQYYPYVTIAVNSNPAMMKIFQSIRVLASKKFECTDIQIPATYDYASGMASVLKANRFNSYEGQWHADFLRDKNDTDKKFDALSPTATKQAHAMLYGRRLRGELMTIKLVAVDGSVATRITRVDTYFIRSEASNP